MAVLGDIGALVALICLPWAILGRMMNNVYWRPFPWLIGAAIVGLLLSGLH